jgi:hypothetical protein
MPDEVQDGARCYGYVTGMFDMLMPTPTDLPGVSARKGKAVADDITVVSVGAIIWLAIIVLALLLADQSFSSPTTEWKYLF